MSSTMNIILFYTVPKMAAAIIFLITLLTTWIPRFFLREHEFLLLTTVIVANNE